MIQTFFFLPNSNFSISFSLYFSQISVIFSPRVPGRFKSGRVAPSWCAGRREAESKTREICLSLGCAHSFYSTCASQPSEQAFPALPLPSSLNVNMNRFIISMIALLAVFCAVSTASPLLYRAPQYQMYDDVQFVKRSNAELINGLIGMDLGKLSAVGKRSNAELINGLLSMNLNKLSGAGRR
nr:pigment dispersing factor 1a [Caenorhabditis elegans]